MPIWAALLARIVLGERLTPARIVSLVVGGGGLAVLIWPLAITGWPVGAFFAVGAGLSWALGTVYIKWAAVKAHPIAIASWQLASGTCAVAIGLLIEGPGSAASIGTPSFIGLTYSTVAGTAIAYLLWFQIVRHLPASVAGLGALLSPVVGVVTSIALIGERLTLSDLIGFACIFAAAIIALRQEANRSATVKERAPQQRQSL